jgi:hypothetical protein
MITNAMIRAAGATAALAALAMTPVAAQDLAERVAAVRT